MENLAYVDPPMTERIEGKTYLMAPCPRPSHNVIAGNIFSIFHHYLKGKKCRAFGDNMDVHLDNENVYVPDVMIVCDRTKIHRDGLHGAPDLAVEVLSPSTAHRDRGPKMRHYAAAGTKEYWIVSPLGKSVEVYLGENGQFCLDYIYYAEYPEDELARMEDSERASLRHDIPVSLYDDFLVSVKEVFEDVDDFL